jgi:hypothetical protein
MYFCFKITAASSNYTRQLPHEMQQGGRFFIDGWRAAVPLPVSASGRSDNKKPLHG